MSAYKPNVKNWVSVSALVGFIILIVYLYFFSEIGQVIAVIAKTSVPIYFLAFICVVCSVVFNTVTWHQILGRLSVKTTFRRAFTLSWVGMFIDAIIPGGWSGDVFKAYLLSKDEGIEGAKTGASIVIKKVFETFISLGALILGILLLAFNFSLESPVIFTVGLTMTFLSLPIVFVLYFSINQSSSQKMLYLVSRIYKRIKGSEGDSTAIEGKLQNSLNDFQEGIKLLKTSPKAMLQPLIFQTIAWVFDVLVLFFIFASLGYLISPDKIIITNTIAVNLQTQGFAFAGITPLLSTTLYNMLGIQSLVSISSSLLTSFPTFWFKVIVSFVAFQVIVFNRAIPFLSPKSADLKTKGPSTPL